MIVAWIVLAGAGMRGETPEYRLSWHPKVGLTVRYRLSMDFTLPSLTMSLTGNLRLRVLKRKGGFNVETQSTDFRIDSGDAVDAVPDQPVTVEPYDAAGHRLTTAEEDSGADYGRLLSLATDFHAPDAPKRVGDEWEARVKRTATGRPGYRYHYKLAKVEKRGDGAHLRVVFHFTETEGRQPVTADGYFLIDPRDGTLTVSEARLSNVQLSEETGLGQAIVRLRRSD